MRVRAPVASDAPAVLDLIVARDIADLGRPDYTLEDLRADRAAPGVEPALDAWLVEDGDGPLGYALLDDRGAALVTVPPASEGRGVGTALREAAEARAIERGEALVRQYVPIVNEAARTHLLDAGYWPAFCYFRMRMDLVGAPAPPAEVPVRAFDRGTDYGPVHALVEEAMAGVPGNEPRSLESWQAAKVEKEGWDPSLWLLHEDADGLSGVVLCERWEDGSATSTTSPSRRARAAGPRPRHAAARPGRAAQRRADGRRALGAGRERERDAALRVGRHEPGLDDRALGEAAPPDVEDDRDRGGKVEARDAAAASGCRRRASARAASSAQRPWRSVPNASSAPPAAPPARARRRGRAQAAAGRRAQRAPRGDGSAKCNPAEPRSAAGSHGSRAPVVSTPAAPAAAATRTTAPTLPRWRGSSSSTTGTRAAGSSGRGVEGRAPRDRDDPRARRPRHESASGRSPASRASAARRSGASRSASRSSAAASSAAAATTSAPKRSACLSAWKPSSSTSRSSARAAAKAAATGRSSVRRPAGARRTPSP